MTHVVVDPVTDRGHLRIEARWTAIRARGLVSSTMFRGVS